jgi:hypothetical protein
MIFDFLSYGFLFIILAIFGFVIKDIVNLSQYWNFPDDYKSDTERFFNYISTAILIIAFATVLLTPSFTSKEPGVAYNFLNVTANTITNLHQMNYISNETYSGIIEDFSLSLVGIIIFSWVYIFIYVIAFSYGLILRYSKAYGVSVVLKSNPETPEIFRELIRESDEFFFFEKDSGINLWTAIKKEDIIRMEMVDLPTRSNKILMKIGNKIFSKYPQYGYLNTPITLFLVFFVIIGLYSLFFDILIAIVFLLGAIVLGYFIYTDKKKFDFKTP